LVDNKIKSGNINQESVANGHNGKHPSKHAPDRTLQDCFIFKGFYHYLKSSQQLREVEIDDKSRPKCKAEKEIPKR